MCDCLLDDFLPEHVLADKLLYFGVWQTGNTEAAAALTAAGK